jgi:hypothetical protein
MYEDIPLPDHVDREQSSMDGLDPTVPKNSVVQSNEASLSPEVHHWYTMQAKKGDS